MSRTYSGLDVRQKAYEQPFNQVLPCRIPLIVRIDGCHFHSYTKTLPRPFDDVFMTAMDNVAAALCQEISGAQLAYVQSDEISLLIHTYKKLDSQAWAGNRVNKITSLTAGIASATMTLESVNVFGEHRSGYFDSRAFVIPESDINNYFLWRQRDATRNSIMVVAQSMYSPKQLHKKNTDELQEMIFQKDVNWNDLPVPYKRGRCIIKETFDLNGAIRTRWIPDNNIPVFSQDTEYIEKYLKTEEE
jgi:tRNA(His) guanylyltransferase